MKLTITKSLDWYEVQDEMGRKKIYVSKPSQDQLEAYEAELKALDEKYKTMHA